MVRAVLIFGVLALGACQVHPPDPCAVTCTAASGCPDGMTCGADNFCYGSGQAMGSCSGSVADGGGDDGNQATCGEGDPCDPVAQCGCDDGQGCYLSGGGESSCLSAGERTQDQTCGADEDCAAGYDCVSAGSGGRHCQKYCGDDGDCEGDLSLCNREVGGGAARICTSDCDPMVGGCRSGEDCVLGIGEDDRFDANCRVPGSGGFLATCVSQSDCGAGLLCVSSAGSGSSCQYVCEVGTTDCGETVPCGRLDPPAFFNDTEYGVCNF